MLVHSLWWSYTCWLFLWRRENHSTLELTLLVIHGLSCLYYKCMGMTVDQCVCFWKFCNLAKLAIIHPKRKRKRIQNWLYTRYESKKNLTMLRHSWQSLEPIINFWQFGRKNHRNVTIWANLSMKNPLQYRLKLYFSGWDLAKFHQWKRSLGLAYIQSYAR